MDERRKLTKCEKRRVNGQGVEQKGQHVEAVEDGRVLETGV